MTVVGLNFVFRVMNGESFLLMAPSEAVDLKHSVALVGVKLAESRLMGGQSDGCWFKSELCSQETKGGI